MIRPIELQSIAVVGEANVAGYGPVLVTVHPNTLKALKGESCGEDLEVLVTATGAGRSGYISLETAKAIQSGQYNEPLLLPCFTRLSVPQPESSPSSRINESGEVSSFGPEALADLLSQSDAHLRNRARRFELDGADDLDVFGLRVAIADYATQKCESISNPGGMFALRPEDARI